jgi:hypothetical protein
MLKFLARLLDSRAARGSQARRARPARPGLEALEGRVVMDVALTGAALGEWSWGERTAEVSDVQVPCIDGSTEAVDVDSSAVAAPAGDLTETAYKIDGSTDVVWQDGSGEALPDLTVHKDALVSDLYWESQPADDASPLPAIYM